MEGIVAGVIVFLIVASLIAVAVINERRRRRKDLPAFDLTSSPATANATSKPETKNQRIVFVLIGVGVLALVALLGVTFVGLYISSQSNTANTSVSEPNRQSTQSSPATAAATGPSDDFITSAVTNIVKHEISNTAMYWSTDNVSVENVEILRRGEFHQNEKFLLVQVRTTGTKHENWRGELTCNNQNIACSRHGTFEGINDYRVFRNDYGDWLVQVAEPWNFRLNRDCDHDSSFP